MEIGLVVGDCPGARVDFDLQGFVSARNDTMGHAERALRGCRKGRIRLRYDCYALSPGAKEYPSRLIGPEGFLVAIA